LKEFLPDLEKMYLYDFAAGRWSTTQNFINHPPFGYHLLNLFAGWADVGPYMRYASILLFVAGFAVINQALNISGMLSGVGLMTVTLLCVFLKLHKFAEIFTNDSVAFLGGALAFLGSVLIWQHTENSHRARGVALMLLGTLLCICTKLNAAILITIYTGISLLPLLRAERKSWQSLATPLNITLSLGCAISAIPYLLFMIEFGSPAPATAGHLAMISAGSPTAPRVGFAEYLVNSLVDAVDNAGPDTRYTYTVFCMVTALSAFAAWRSPRQDNTLVFRQVARSTVVATVIMVTIHLAFSYQRHLEFGWQTELYPRYYFALLGPYCLLFFFGLTRLKLLGALTPATNQMK
jgi:hypothetical protein